MDSNEYPHPWEQDQALTDQGYDENRCREYRNNPDNQKRASTHTVMKCMRCMTSCDKKRIKELLK